MTVSEAIVALEQTLPTHLPELWESLAPPASAEELELLRAAVAPLEVPLELEAVLSWHNGGSWGGAWWPITDSGHLLGTSEAAAHYQWLCENSEEWQWSRSWLPLTHEGWNQCGIEVGSEQHGILIDASFPDPPRAIAPSLVALLHASCAVIEAGLYDERPLQTSDGAYARVKQLGVIEPIFSRYGATPDHLVEG